jgi:GntR family transcriptional regulator, transcriptional repressor for pyruvate dehydrogenase complex
LEQVGTSGRVTDAIGAISRHIREKDLMPGDRLPSEALLSKELNVSRTVVREAFRSLAAMRIIELATGKRATVAQIDHGAMSLMIEHGVHTDQISIQQIYDVRRTIENRIVTLASIRRTDSEAAQILALANDMRDNVGLAEPGLFADYRCVSRHYPPHLADRMEKPTNSGLTRSDGGNPCRDCRGRGRQRPATGDGGDVAAFR